MSPFEWCMFAATISGPFLSVWLFSRDAKKEAKTEGHEAGTRDMKLQVAIDLLTEFRAELKLIPVLVTRMTTLENVVSSHIRSDHRELRGEVAKLRDSIHDGE